jgi:hypothetical protein
MLASSERLANKLTDELKRYPRLTEELCSALDSEGLDSEGLHGMTAGASGSAILSKQMREVLWPGFIAYTTWVIAYGFEADDVLRWFIRVPLIFAFIFFLLGQAYNCFSSSAHRYSRRAMPLAVFVTSLMVIFLQLIYLALRYWARVPAEGASWMNEFFLLAVLLWVLLWPRCCPNLFGCSWRLLCCMRDRSRAVDEDLEQPLGTEPERAMHPAEHQS